jgi:hypothetical protein
MFVYLLQDAAMCSIIFGWLGLPDIFPIKSGYRKGKGPPPPIAGGGRIGVGGEKFLSGFTSTKLAFSAESFSIFLSLTFEVVDRGLVSLVATGEDDLQEWVSSADDAGLPGVSTDF